MHDDGPGDEAGGLEEVLRGPHPRQGEGIDAHAAPGRGPLDGGVEQQLPHADPPPLGLDVDVVDDRQLAAVGQRLDAHDGVADDGAVDRPDQHEPVGRRHEACRPVALAGPQLAAALLGQLGRGRREQGLDRGRVVGRRRASGLVHDD